MKYNSVEKQAAIKSVISQARNGACFPVPVASEDLPALVEFLREGGLVSVYDNDDTVYVLRRDNPNETRQFKKSPVSLDDELISVVRQFVEWSKTADSSECQSWHAAIVTYDIDWKSVTPGWVFDDGVGVIKSAFVE